MVKFSAYAIIFLILFIVQIAILPFFSFYGSAPNILFVLCAFLAFYLSSYRDLMLFSFISALSIDLYSGQPFGVGIVSFLISVAIAHFMSKNILGKANFMIVFLGTITASAVYSFCYFAIVKILGLFEVIGSSNIGISFLWGFIITIISNLLLAVILYMPFKRILRMLERN